ncbi:hypothetical protein Bca4012_059303 [Brassica carinata]|uniref:C2H2-type domain-containing protein n=1 Tax=Brassica carinata TaxID=52824 RepID=A0A8X7V2G6_BRACI|nr:hypothetical protein Bca52824_029656 [Brassica carinata]
MPVDRENSSTVSGDASVVSSTGNQNPPPPKKKRNLPGMPDPGAEVIALSPKTLMATNRFVCEICSKGFQRDQNLQLHRRGHNLPWKLRQRSSKEVRKKVYVCPVSGCVHHDPSRALGDLTGIKKHFCRKHGEKKYKCDKCSKKYAVHSDWKAHSKICGTKEYRCDCATLFSRKDSFLTHRAFCDVLAQETANNHLTQTNLLFPQTLLLPDPEPHLKSPAAPPTSPPSVALPTKIASPSVLPVPSSSESPQDNPLEVIMEEEAIGFNVSSSGGISGDPTSNSNGTPRTLGFNMSSSVGISGDHSSNNNNGIYAGLFSSTSTASPSLYASSTPSTSPFPPPSSSMEPISLCLSTNPSLFGPTIQDPPPPHFLTPLSLPPPQPAMSATALLQKAAQMGSTGSGGSLLRGLGIVSTTSSSMELSSHDLGLGLLPCSSGGSGLKELMLGNSCVFGPKQTTLDFLGLGRAVGNGSSNPGGGLSALLTSIGGGGGMDVFGTAAEFSGKDIGRSS